LAKGAFTLKMMFRFSAFSSETLICNRTILANALRYFPIRKHRLEQAGKIGFEKLHSEIKIGLFLGHCRYMGCVMDYGKLKSDRNQQVSIRKNAFQSLRRRTLLSP
jgi:hypothetical protein